MSTNEERNILVKFANCSEYAKLTKEQFEAVDSRNLLESKKLGLNLDIYLSLIDPDYPVIVAG